MSDDTIPDPPTIIAHRGFAGVYPENTAYAVWQAGSDDGIAMVEVDVVPTADGTVVCFHDDHLHQTERSRGITNARGTVWETDTETVLNAVVLESGETVPRLETVLDAIAPDVGINIELKNYGGVDSAFARALEPAEREIDRHRWEPFVADVLDVLDGFHGPILVSSFYEGALAAIRKQAPELPIGVLVWDSLEAGLAVADRHQAEAIHPPSDLVQGTPSPSNRSRNTEATVDVVEAAHGADRAVNVWAVETWYQADQLARRGVDGLIVDYPRLDDSIATVGDRVEP